MISRSSEAEGYVDITCDSCGHLGVFYLDASQHLAGALLRAERLQDGHKHPELVRIMKP